MRKKLKQVTLGDIRKMQEPDETKISVEWTDGNGYHICPATGVWESESGSVVLTVGAEQKVAEQKVAEQDGAE